MRVHRDRPAEALPLGGRRGERLVYWSKRFDEMKPVWCRLASRSFKVSTMTPLVEGKGVIWLAVGIWPSGQNACAFDAYEAIKAKQPKLDSFPCHTHTLDIRIRYTATALQYLRPVNKTWRFIHKIHYRKYPTTTTVVSTFSTTVPVFGGLRTQGISDRLKGWARFPPHPSNDQNTLSRSRKQLTITYKSVHPFDLLLLYKIFR